MVEASYEILKELRKGRRKRVVAALNTLLATMPLVDRSRGTDEEV